MISGLKAEFRKLFTVRSTYFIAAITFVIAVALLGFWVYGYKDVDHAAGNSKALLDSMLGSISTAGIFMSFIAVLMVGHEYRYNTIMYSLTNSNSRTKVFLSKLGALAVFALGFGVVIVLLNWACFYVGAGIHHVHPMAQSVPLWDLVWRSGVTMLGDAAYAFIIAMLLRNLIGAIAVVLVLPSTIENLLTLILHDNTKYLPYTALSKFADLGTHANLTQNLITVCAYVAVLGVTAWVLFLKRDAN
jgi:ABC-type transport system involved in multi-copper enzyme maturation permease subunit